VSDLKSAKRELEKLLQVGRLREARALGEQLSAAFPQDADAWYLRGMAEAQADALEAAAQSFRRVLALAPGDAITHYNLARIHRLQGRIDAAVAGYRESLRLQPGLAEAHLSLGDIARDRGELKQALIHYENALNARTGYAEAYNNLGIVLKRRGDPEGALTAWRKAIECRPDLAAGWNNIGDELRQNGDPRLAIEHYRRALALRPDFSLAHSNVLFALSYHVLASPEELLAESREWDRRHGAAGRAAAYTHVRTGDPEKRLKVGYVSPDLKRHSVSYFFEPILRAHDRGVVEVYCYAEVNEPDGVTERLRQEADHWRSTVGLSDEALARQIHDDGIDVLVDLAGHTAHNRLLAFTYRPAPIQATYLGYFATTGLSAMDYWLSDAVLTPQDTVERTTEEIWRLPRCCVSYAPPSEAGTVTTRINDGPVTFGSFNHISKISDETVGLWGAVLHAVPNSRLILKTRYLRDETTRTRVLARFTDVGIEAERIELRGGTPGITEHFAAYGDIDIALDTIPRTGGTTTADALWMGVPVVSLAGRRFIERLSATMLTAVGLEELIAADREEYVAIAVALAQDRKRRAELRSDLRARMAASDLCDGRGLAAALETGYRAMWQRHLAEPHGEAHERAE